MRTGHEGVGHEGVGHEGVGHEGLRRKGGTFLNGWTGGLNRP